MNAKTGLSREHITELMEIISNNGAISGKKLTEFIRQCELTRVNHKNFATLHTETVQDVIKL